MVFWGKTMGKEVKYEDIINGIETGARVTAEVVKEGAQITKDVVGALISSLFSGFSSDTDTNKKNEAENGANLESPSDSVFLSIKQTVEELKNQVASLRKSLENDNYAILAYKKQAEEVQKQNQELRQTIVLEQENIAKLRDEINEKLTELNSLKQDKTDEEENKLKVAELEDVISILEANRKRKVLESEKKNTELEKNNKNLIKELSDKEQLINAKSEELNSIKKAYEQQAIKIDEYKHKTEDLEQELERTNELLEIAPGKVDDDTLERIEKTIQIKEGELAEGKEKNREITQDNLRLKIEIDSSNALINKMNDNLSEIKRNTNYEVTSSFYEKKKTIITELEVIKAEENKLTFCSEFDDVENLVYFSDDERGIFWKDIRKILTGEIIKSKQLIRNTYYLKKENLYALYYSINDNKVTIKYLDGYVNSKVDYGKFNEMVTNAYLLSDDMIRYKVFDMLMSAQKEVLILMPWVNDYGWNDDRYGTSINDVIEKLFSTNPQLEVLIAVGYDEQDRDAFKEKKTREKAELIKKEFEKYGDRFKLKSDIGTHEKIVTVDNWCALSGSYNLLSNNAPYDERRWASDEMTVFENSKNVERRRKHVFERTGLDYYTLD